MNILKGSKTFFGGWGGGAAKATNKVEVMIISVYVRRSRYITIQFTVLLYFVLCQTRED